jgi:ADP-heptose:LPS heptosyltransferase/GT2 family glycosyltransferase
VLGQHKPWMLRRKIGRSEINLTENILSGLGWRPLFGILLGVSESDDDAALDATLQSVREQVYRRWHVVVASKDSGIPERLAVRLISEFPDLSDRVSFVAGGDATGFAEALAQASGGRRPDLVGILSAGDVLGCDTLLQMAVWTGMHRDADFFYADERRMSPISSKVEAFFKPQWSPDLLLATNYIGRFWCAAPGLLDRVGARLSDWHRFGEYDLVLRCTEAARNIRHVPHLLCERGALRIDDPAREREALARAIMRRGIDGNIEEGCAPGYYRLRRRLRNRGRVSIIIPTTGKLALLRTCLTGLFELTDYQDFELIILLNNTDQSPEVFSYLETIARDPRVKLVDFKEPFNFSRICNVGAAAAIGEFLLFLNDDVEVIEPAWLEAMLGHAERPEVGVVGARLLYPDGRVQHAGMFWVVGEGGGRHSFRFAPRSDPGYFGLAMTPRNVLMVTGACIMLRREWFEAIGRFDESHSVVNNDVDLCLRSWSNGGLVVYEPAVTLIHHESASRVDMPDEYDVDGFWEKWGKILKAGDPYYHPNLSRDSDNYAVDDEPVQLFYAGHPLFRGDDIRRILVLKLDHIGDFIASAPALQRLRSHFPNADLYLLAPPANGVLASLVPGIKEVINFEFFFARSDLGQRELSEEDLVALKHRLAPYRFDLAVDLRKQLETREVLRFTGARWLAGYDRHNHFPWLDIALEQETDDSLISKRSQIGDDLSRLVDAIALAASRERKILRLRGTERPIERAQSGRRLVCIHPGVGTSTRQWPAEHFAALIDLLVSNHDFDVVLVGGADEADTAAEVLSKVKHKETVRSLVGVTRLADLPALLASAALFVGNNSGPNHIAAGLGVPTIGIYSGVVDAREWGPIGPNAVAVQRDMYCSPCYIAKVGDCPRGMACVTELNPSTIYEVCKQILATSVMSRTPAQWAA